MTLAEKYNKLVVRRDGRLSKKEFSVFFRQITDNIVIYSFVNLPGTYDIVFDDGSLLYIKGEEQCLI